MGSPAPFYGSLHFRKIKDLPVAGFKYNRFLPYATFNEEYKLPQLGAKVVVIHLSNGGEMGICVVAFFVATAFFCPWYSFMTVAFVMRFWQRCNSRVIV